jgi:hypothetical protein
MILPYFIIIPLLAAFLIPLVSRRRDTGAVVLSLAAASSLLVLAAIAFLGLDGKTLVYRMSAWKLPIGIPLVLDALSAFMLMMVGLIALTSLVFSVKYIRRLGRDWRYYALFMLLVTGMTGHHTGDLFNLSFRRSPCSPPGPAAPANPSSRPSYAVSLDLLLPHPPRHRRHLRRDLDAGPGHDRAKPRREEPAPRPLDGRPVHGRLRGQDGGHALPRLAPRRPLVRPVAHLGHAQRRPDQDAGRLRPHPALHNASARHLFLDIFLASAVSIPWATLADRTMGPQASLAQQHQSGHYILLGMGLGTTWAWPPSSSQSRCLWSSSTRRALGDRAGHADLRQMGNVTRSARHLQDLDGASLSRRDPAV